MIIFLSFVMRLNIYGTICLALLAKPGSAPGSARSLFICFFRYCSKDLVGVRMRVSFWNVGVFVILWSMWLERNSRIFNDQLWIELSMASLWALAWGAYLGVSISVMQPDWRALIFRAFWVFFFSFFSFLYFSIDEVHLLYISFVIYIIFCFS